MKSVFLTTMMITILTISSAPAWADCPLAHTHIGINPTARPGQIDPDQTDNSKLWFFSLPPAHDAGTPGWPNWSNADGSTFLLASPETGGGGAPIFKATDPTKQLYTCRFMYSKANGYGDPLGTQHLDGWHSAHGPDGMWSLESVDDQTEPDWELHLMRESTSFADETDFFMEMPGGLEVLASDASTHQLPKVWLGDKSAWGFHEHMSFYFWLAADGSDIGSEVSATFSVYDAGGMYTSSDPFTFNFTVVPEPASLGLMVLGSLALMQRRRR